MERKRQRRRVCCLTFAALLALIPETCQAFHPVSRGFKRPLGIVRLYGSSNTAALVLEPPLDSYSEEDAMIHLDWLEYSLLEEGFTFEDVFEIIQAIKRTSDGDVARTVGAIDFLRLILQLNEDGDMFCTKQVLLASVLHFSDCITVRETGVYEMVRRAVHGKKTNYRALPSARTDPEAETYNDITRSIISATRRQELSSEAYEDYGEEVTRIGRDAARVKRAEILAQVVLDTGRTPSKEEASRLRGLLLSVMDDWRALAIRSVACLYRLEGILYNAEQGAAEYVRLSPENVKATREALHVYAPLAQRLGMQRLKAKLEDRAFRIMYRRQYDVVSSLFSESRAEMALISSDLSSRMEQVLRQTPGLMDELEELRVTSRVKEPYSLWKKLLKLRNRGGTKSLPALEGTKTTLAGFTESSELSLLDIKDGIAVRVILKARRWSPDEPDETVRYRERVLCYYVQHVLRDYWPVVDKSRVKDYIRYPKSNGYQSLHYTSAIKSDGSTWPFEVQVRSQEMHRIAEYGVAAHWDYKFSYIDALVTAKEDLVQQKVFVFFAGSSALDNEGQLLSLPVGARVVDAISELKDHLDLDVDVPTDDGSVLRNGRADGRAAKPDEYISNGDVLLITM